MLKDLKKIIPNYPFDIVYLRKYTPKGKYVTDDIFRKRFEKTKYIYFDIYFKHENIEIYKERIRKTLSLIDKVSKRQKNVLVCLQEIKPLLEFLVVLEEFSSFQLQFPQIDKDLQNKEFHEQNFKTLFFKSNSILLQRNFHYTIYQTKSSNNDKNDDIIMDFFMRKRKLNNEWITERNKNQNVKYFIPTMNLYIYNVHSFLYKDNRIIKFFENLCIPYLKQIPKNILIIGDLNFQMSFRILSTVQDLLTKENIVHSFVETPFYKKKQTFDGYLLKLL